MCVVESKYKRDGEVKFVDWFVITCKLYKKIYDY